MNSNLDEVTLRNFYQQLTNLNIDYEIFTVSREELVKNSILANKAVEFFFKRLGLHDYSAQHHAPKIRRSIPLLVITKEQLKKNVTLSLFRETSENNRPAFWPSKNYAVIEENDICAFISYFNFVILVNVSKIDQRHIGIILRKLGLSNEIPTSFNSIHKIVSNYEKLNFAINQHIKSEFYKEKELYLDFEDDLVQHISKIAKISPDVLEEVIISSAREKLNFDNSNPFSDLQSTSLAWKRSGYAYDPPTTIFLSALSIIAEGMGADQNFGANNFYDRLLSAFQIQPPQWQQAIKDNFKTTVSIWEDFNSWLIRTDGRYGFATAHPIVKNWKYVSYGMSQALIRKGDKKHLNNYLAAKNVDAFFDDLYGVLDAYFNSTAAHKYLKIIWQQRHLRPKVLSAAQEQLLQISQIRSDDRKFSKLLLRVQIKSFPYKSFQPFIVYEQEEGLENNLKIDTSNHNPAFKQNAKLILSPIGDGFSVLGPPSSLAIDNFLFGNVTLNFIGDAARSFVFRPKPAMALAEVEPGIFQQTTRPEVFKKHLILAQTKYQKNVCNFLKHCADSSFQLVANPKPISDKFVIFKDVVFVRPVSVDEMESKDDPTYWIRPIETMADIDIRNGLKLVKNIYHDNSLVELLVSTGKPIFDVKLHVGETNRKFSKTIRTEDGVGYVQLKDLIPVNEYIGRDVEINISLPNYKATTISFRSSKNAVSKFEFQPKYDLVAENNLGFLSVTENPKLAGFVSGFTTNKLPTILARHSNFNAGNNGYSRIFSSDNDTDFWSYFHNSDSGATESCASRGYHYWRIMEDREGFCIDCAERRKFPRSNRSRQQTSRKAEAKNQIKRTYKILNPKNNYTTGDILDSVFFLQDLSWQRFKEICGAISDDVLFANELLRNFAAIGHVDIKLDPITLKPQRIYSSLPTLIKVRDQYLLTGYSNSELVQQIGGIAGKMQYYEVGKVWASLPIKIPSFASFDLEKNIYKVRSLVDQLNRPLSIVECIGSELISALPNLSDVYQNLPQISVANDGLQKFNSITGRWQPAASAQIDGGYRQIWPTHTYFIRTKGVFRQATFELTKLFAADLENAPLHNYSAAKMTFSSKLGCELPTLFQRALVAFSGKLPEKSEDGEILYKDVPAPAGKMIISKVYGQVI